jgi:transposase
MQGTWRGDEDEFIVYGSLRSLIPADHVLRRLDAVLDLSWVPERVAPCYSLRCMKPSFAPETMLRLILARFVLGIDSNRALCRWAQTDLALRWFCGLALDRQAPDHSTLSKTLERWGQELFGELFERGVQQAREAGLVEGRRLHVDATLLRADVGLATMSAEFGAQVWAEVERERRGEAVAEEDDEERPAAPPGGFSEEAFPTRTRARGHGPGAGKRSKTDPEASLARRSSRERCVPSYKQHTVVDDAHRIIVDVEVTTGEQHEGQRLLSAVARAQGRLGGSVAQVTADAGYGSAAVLAGLEAAGLEAVVKTPKPAAGGRCAARQFKYDERHDHLTCPRGRRLTRRSRKDNGWEYRARACDCRGCPLAAICLSPAGRARSVWLPDGYAALVRARRAREKGWPAEWREAYERHRWQVEGVQGEAKNGHGLARAAWRGLRKVRWQALLTAAILNLKRMAAAAAAAKLQEAAQGALGRALGALPAAWRRVRRTAAPPRPALGVAPA